MPLHLAVGTGNAALVRLILDDPRIDVNRINAVRVIVSSYLDFDGSHWHPPSVPRISHPRASFSTETRLWHLRDSKAEQRSLHS